MRVIAVAALATALLITGLISQSAQRATASSPAQTASTIDPAALHSTVDMKSLPEQQTVEPF
jgi:hypothetical protein